MSPLLQFLLNMLGLNPLRKRKVRYHSFLRFSAGFTTVFIETNMLMGAILNWEGVVTMAAYVFVTAFIVLTAQFYNLWLNKEGFVQLVKSIENLWPLDRFGKEFEEKMNTIINYARLYCFAFVFSAYFVVALMTAVPIITGKNELQFNGYDFCDLNNTICFQTRLWFSGIFCYLHWIPSSVGSDCLLIFLICRAYASLEMIKRGLRELDISSPTCLEEISEIAEQHYLTIKFVQDMDGLYHFITALQFLCSMGNLVFSSYMLTSEGFPPPPELIGKFGVLYIVYLNQLMAISVAGGILATQTKTVAHEAFYTNWWIQTNPSARKGLAFIIQMSQKGHQLTVGKVMQLNVEAFVTVLKTSVSYYMMLNALDAERINSI